MLGVILSLDALSCFAGPTLWRACGPEKLGAGREVATLSLPFGTAITDFNLVLASLEAGADVGADCCCGFDCGGCCWGFGVEASEAGVGTS